jgi:2-polyprenyl-3-methyl-5-hydroxy-6-metoxy-1,4-benzoquinol methylase
MDYRERLYRHYASEHTSHLYGAASLKSIEAQFPVWDAYFGAWLPQKKDAKILDVGCGDGGFVHWLHAKGFSGAAGIDVSAEQVKAGSDMGIKHLQERSIESYLPEHKGEFDLVIARDIFEHFKKEEVLDLLDMLHAALRPGGSVIVQTVNAENILWGRLRHGDFTHEHALTATSAHQILAAAGFGRIEIAPQRPVAHGIASSFRAFLWRLIELKMRCYLLIETGSSKGVFTQNLLIRASRL